MPAAKRRTQSERREATIARLLDAVISSLAEDGYSRTTTSGVCQRAELSQGALFRHFASRCELISAAAEEICRRHVGLVQSSLEAVQKSPRNEAARTLVTTIREAARTPEHAAWHEVMVAARCDEELRVLVAPTLQSFEETLLASLGGLGGKRDQGRIGTIVLSLMHLFDSEAVTVAVYGNPSLEADRLDWLSSLLERELAQL
jgi:AcrR family transcriptional regulator